MKKILWILSMASLCGSAYAADFTDTARVISSTPIYEQSSEPHRECSAETASAAPKKHSIGGAVIGGAAGALLGSRIGKGKGKKAAAVVGGVAGAVAGDRIASSNQSQTQQAERCKEVEASQVVKGYKVTYRYNGQDITTVLPYKPDSTIRIRINAIEDPH